MKTRTLTAAVVIAVAWVSAARDPRTAVRGLYGAEAEQTAGPSTALGRHIEKTLATRPVRADEPWCFGVIADPHLRFLGPKWNEKKLTGQFRRWAEVGAAFGVAVGDLGGGPRKETPQRFVELMAAAGCPPLVMSIGNHECDGPGKRGWLDALYPGAVTGLSKKGNDRYIHYSFDYRGCHFVCLDANRIAGRAWHADRVPDEQLAWLARDLAANKGKLTFVFLHEPTVILRGGKVKRHLKNADALLALLGQHPDARWLFHGHLHEDYQIRVGSLNVVHTVVRDLAVRVTGRRAELCRITGGKLKPVPAPFRDVQKSLGARRDRKQMRLPRALPAARP